MFLLCLYSKKYKDMKSYAGHQPWSIVFPLSWNTYSLKITKEKVILRQKIFWLMVSNLHIAPLRTVYIHIFFISCFPPFFVYVIILNEWNNLGVLGLVRLHRDDSKYGYDSDGQNFYLKDHHEFQKMVLISFKDL